MGIEEGEMTEDLENEFLPEGGYRLAGLMDEQGIQRIARQLTEEEQAIKEKLEGKGADSDADGRSEAHQRSFQVVRGDMFCQITAPVMRITPTSVNVNRQCAEKLPDTAYAEILLNPVERAVVIRPSVEGFANAVKWGQTIRGACFCKLLYEIMGWDENYSYKLPATVKRNGDERVLYFDMDNYIGRAMRRKTDENIIPEKRERPRETEETKGFFYGPDDNEPQSIEELREIEERFQQARKAERRTFGEPAFQFFTAEAAVLDGEGSLMTEAEPISKAVEIPEAKTKKLLKAIAEDPPTFPYGKVIYSTDPIASQKESKVENENNNGEGEAQ